MKDKVQHYANAAVQEEISFICIDMSSHALSKGKEYMFTTLVFRLSVNVYCNLHPQVGLYC